MALGYRQPVLLAKIGFNIGLIRTFNFINFVGEREINMGNPLDSLKGTVVLGLIITVVMVLLVNAIAA